MRAWRLHVIDADGRPRRVPLFADSAGDDEQQPRVSPDGARVAYVSIARATTATTTCGSRSSRRGARDRVNRARLVRVRGVEGFPAWSPDGARIAFFAVREDAGGVWVVNIADPLVPAPAPGRRRTRARPRAPESRCARVASWRRAGVVTRRQAAGDRQPAAARSRVQRQSRARSATIRRRSSPRQERSGCGSSTHRCRWTPARARSCTAAPRARATDRGVRPRLGHAAAALLRDWSISRSLAGAANDSTARRRRAAADETALESTVDAMVAEQPLIKPLVVSDASRRRLRPPAGLAKPGARARARRQHRRRRYRRLVRARRRRAGRVGHRRRRHGDALPEGHGRADRDRLQGSDRRSTRRWTIRDLPRPPRRRRPGSGEHPRRRGGTRSICYRSYGSRRIRVGGSRRAGDRLRRATAYELDEALPTTIAEGRQFFEKYPDRGADLSAERPRAEARASGSSTRTTRRRCATIATEGAEAFYRGVDRAPHRRRHGSERRPHRHRGSRAVPRHRAAPADGRYRGHRDLHGAAAGVDRRVADRDAADPATLRAAAAARTLRDRRRLLPLRDRGVEGARSGPRASPIRRSGRSSLRPHLEPAHAATLFKRIDPADARYRDRRRRRGRRRPQAERIGRGTTAFAVADADGNMIAVTQTLSTWGGTFYVSDGLGFLYNNHLRFEPDDAGRLRSAAAAHALVVDQRADAGVPRARLRRRRRAAPGGRRRRQRVDPRVGLRHHRSRRRRRHAAQRAIEAPRFLVARDPADAPAPAAHADRGSLPAVVLDDLTARGHRFQKIGRKGEVRYGYAAAAVVDVGGGRVRAAPSRGVRTPLSPSDRRRRRQPAADYFRPTSATRATSARGVKGFPMCAVNPSESACVRSSARA